jgi:hypothetical protein
VSAPPQGSRRDLPATLAILGIFAALAAGRPIYRRLAPHPTPERCAAMLERYAEQEARARNRTPVPSHLPLDAPEVARCTRELTDAEISCALQAGYADELERCLP